MSENEKTSKPCHKAKIKCDRCGKITKCNSSRQLYCKECGIINNKEYQHTYIKKYRTTDVGKANFKKLLFKQQRKKHSDKIIETFTMNQWFKKLDSTNGICPGCEKFIGKDKLTMDHIYPTSKAEKGRVYTINDIQPLCRGCNTRKGNKC